MPYRCKNNGHPEKRVRPPQAAPAIAPDRDAAGQVQTLAKIAGPRLLIRQQ